MLSHLARGNTGHACSGRDIPNHHGSRCYDATHSDAYSLDDGRAYSNMAFRSDHYSAGKYDARGDMRVIANVTIVIHARARIYYCVPPEATTGLNHHTRHDLCSFGNFGILRYNCRRVNHVGKAISVQFEAPEQLHPICW
jgi:hypothetical protein